LDSGACHRAFWIYFGILAIGILGGGRAWPADAEETAVSQPEEPLQFEERAGEAPSKVDVLVGELDDKNHTTEISGFTVPMPGDIAPFTYDMPLFENQGKEPLGFCGDGHVDPTEGCDDGNRTSGDGCSEFCTLEAMIQCGNGILDPGESCDDGNLSDGDGCSSVCTGEVELVPKAAPSAEPAAATGPSISITAGLPDWLNPSAVPQKPVPSAGDDAGGPPLLPGSSASVSASAQKAVGEDGMPVPLAPCPNQEVPCRARCVPADCNPRGGSWIQIMQRNERGECELTGIGFQGERPSASGEYVSRSDKIIRSCATGEADAKSMTLSDPENAAERAAAPGGEAAYCYCDGPA